MIWKNNVHLTCVFNCQREYTNVHFGGYKRLDNSFVKLELPGKRLSFHTFPFVVEFGYFLTLHLLYDCE